MRVTGALCAAVVMALVSTICSAEEPTVDTEYMGALVYAAKRGATLYPDFYRIHPQLDEQQLYAVQRNVVSRYLSDGDQIAGFKGGFIPTAPVGGVVLASGLLKNEITVKASDFHLLIIEAEFGFRFCADVSAPLADIAALKDVVCEIVPALEIADGALADFGSVKRDLVHLRKALIPLNVAFKTLLVGVPVAAATLELESIPVVTRRGAVELGHRDLSKASDLWANVLWVVNEFALAQGYEIRAGQVVIPGNQTGIHLGEPGAYEADFGALGRVVVKVVP